MEQIQSLTMMAAKAVKNINMGSYDYVFPDGWRVEVERSLEFPEQLKVKVRKPSPSFEEVSEMLVWAR